ncbi:sulfite exporter TauE/SafE family protein [Flavobacterium sp.]|uniref:sulfite exporter TauE/SafE family protein n=1 Tax=Flavobacterium sp. TaxID=239 RepID=UPI002A83411E|nr:sulfite exporter TauE/SafE family protein [Flavobacterium sp.]
MEIVGYIGALIIGLVLGLTGGGGSILTVPILVYILSFSPITAAAYSLFIVGTTSAFGASVNYFKGLVDVKTGFIFAIPSFIAVFITRKYIVQSIPNHIIQSDNLVITKDAFLMGFFAIVMLFAAISMLKKKKNEIDNTTQIKTSTLVIQNFIIGIIIGLIGAGGGFLIIPSLVLFAKLPMKRAVATSLFIISMNSLIGFLGDVQNIEINWQFLLPFTLVTILGILIGIGLNKFINESQLKKGFGYFVLLMALFILSKEFLFM